MIFIYLHTSDGQVMEESERFHQPLGFSYHAIRTVRGYALLCPGPHHLLRGQQGPESGPA